jgi:hypothetical protein
VSDRTISNVSITPQSIDISYMAETDVRAEGAIYQVHQLSISAIDEFLSDEIEEFEEALDRLLEAAIHRWASTMPVDLHPREDEDDDDDED